MCCKKGAPNPTQDVGGPKMPPISFSFVTSTNVGGSPKNFMTFGFDLFAISVQNFKAIPSASPKLLNLNKTTSQKSFFCSNPYKTEVIITSLIEMLKLPNFGHMTKFTT